MGRDKLTKMGDAHGSEGGRRGFEYVYRMLIRRY